jgi:hypothetical protein
MSDIQIGAPESQEAEESADVGFADPACPDSELVPDMLSKRAHRLLDEKILQRYTWIDGDEEDENSIYPRVTLLRSLARDYDQLNPRLTDTDYFGHGTVLRTCLEGHPWLVSVLNECGRKGSFRTVRLLSEYIRNTLRLDLQLLISPCLLMPTFLRIQRFYNATTCHIELSTYGVC